MACPVCTDDTHALVAFCACGVRVCADCLDAYLVGAVRQSNFVRCLGPECGRVVDILAAGHWRWERYVEHRLNAWKPRWREVVTEAEYRLAAIADVMPALDDTDDRIAALLDVVLPEEVVADGVKRCPGCSAPTVRGDGCPKLMCPRCLTWWDWDTGTLDVEGHVPGHQPGGQDDHALFFETVGRKFGVAGAIFASRLLARRNKPAEPFLPAVVVALALIGGAPGTTEESIIYVVREKLVMETMTLLDRRIIGQYIYDLTTALLDGREVRAIEEGVAMALAREGLPMIPRLPR